MEQKTEEILKNTRTHIQKHKQTHMHTKIEREKAVCSSFCWSVFRWLSLGETESSVD